MEKIYKIIGLDLISGLAEAQGDKSETTLKNVEKSVVSDLENILNKHCDTNNSWRFESITTLKFTWDGKVHEKPIVILKDIDHF
jgi:hypothetical protein